MNKKTVTIIIVVIILFVSIAIGFFYFSQEKDVAVLPSSAPAPSDSNISSIPPKEKVDVIEEKNGFCSSDSNEKKEIGDTWNENWGKDFNKLTCDCYEDKDMRPYKPKFCSDSNIDCSDDYIITDCKKEVVCGNKKLEISIKYYPSYEDGEGKFNRADPNGSSTRPIFNYYMDNKKIDEQQAGLYAVQWNPRCDDGNIVINFSAGDGPGRSSGFLTFDGEKTERSFCTISDKEYDPGETRLTEKECSEFTANKDKYYSF